MVAESDPDLLTATDEAAVFGRHKTMVSRHRRRPDHPVNLPEADDWTITIGSRVHRRAPRVLLAAYWDGIQSGGGRPRTTPAPAEPQEQT